MHCGFMPRDSWIDVEGALPKTIGPDEYTCDMCPGWLMRQPAVIDGVSAWKAREKNSLPMWDPENSQLVWECVEIFDRAMSLSLAEKQRVMSERLKRG